MRQAAPVIITAKSERKLVYSVSTGAGTLLRNAIYFIALDSRKFSGGLSDLPVKTQIESITTPQGARLANSLREANIKPLKRDGLPIERELLERLESYSAASLGNSSRAARKAASS